MFKKLLALVLLSGTFAAASVAQTVKVGVVDFTRAISETTEGQAAKTRLEAMASGKQAELEQMDASLQALATEYQEKAPMLSAEARQSFEQRIYEGQMQLQQAAAVADQQMQMQQVQVMDTVFNSLKGHASAIAQAEGYTVVLEASQVIYAIDGIDLTDKVISRANGGQ